MDKLEKTVVFIQGSYYRVDMDDFVDSIYSSFKNVDFLDISNLLDEKRSENNPLSEEKLPKPVRRFNDYNSFNNYLKDGIKVVVMPMNGRLIYKNIRLYWTLNKPNIKIVGRQVNSAVIPEGYYASSAGYREKKSFLVKNIKRVQLLIYLLLLKIKIFPKYSLYFISGKKLLKNITKYREKYEEVIETNSYVYDSYLGEKRETSDEYVVFLDANIPLHPEYKDRGFENIDADRYYGKLRETFTLIEETTGKEVIICAHPLYIMDDAKKHYGNRAVYKFKTDEYIPKAYAVIVNATSAINKAVMYKKPIIQLKSDEFNDFIKNEIILYEDLLHLNGFDFYNLKKDEVSAVFNNLHVDINAYSKYIVDFLAVSDSLSETSTEKIIMTIKERYFN